MYYKNYLKLLIKIHKIKSPTIRDFVIVKEVFVKH